MRRALASLYVFKGHVVDAFPSAEGMAKVASAFARNSARCLSPLHGLQRSHQSMRISQRNFAGGETGHRIAEDGLCGVPSGLSFSRRQ